MDGLSKCCKTCGHQEAWHNKGLCNFAGCGCLHFRPCEVAEKQPEADVEREHQEYIALQTILIKAFMAISLNDELKVVHEAYWVKRADICEETIKAIHSLRPTASVERVKKILTEAKETGLLVINDDKFGTVENQLAQEIAGEDV